MTPEGQNSLSGLDRSVEDVAIHLIVIARTIAMVINIYPVSASISHQPPHKQQLTIHNPLIPPNFHPSPLQYSLLLNNVLELLRKSRVLISLPPSEHHLPAIDDPPHRVAGLLVVDGLGLGADVPFGGRVQVGVDDVGLLCWVRSEGVRPLRR